VEREPDTPVAAGRTGAPLAIVPTATHTQAGDGLRLNHYLRGRFTRPAFAAPAVTTGATSAVDGLNQQFLAGFRSAAGGNALGGWHDGAALLDPAFDA
jgi:hypothetical protein